MQSGLDIARAWLVAKPGFVIKLDPSLQFLWACRPEQTRLPNDTTNQLRPCNGAVDQVETQDALLRLSVQARQP